MLFGMLLSVGQIVQSTVFLPVTHKKAQLLLLKERVLARFEF